MKKHTLFALVMLLACAPLAQAAYRGGVATASNGTTQTVTVSGIGIQANDIVLLTLVDYIGNTPTWPSGFAQVPGTSPEVNDGNTGVYVYYKVATGSEPTSYSVSGVNYGGALMCAVYSGRNTSSPFTTSSQTPSGSGMAFPLSFSITGVTAGAGDDVVVFAGEQPGGGSTAATLSYTPDAAYSNGLLANDTVDYGAQWGVSSNKLNVSAGATGTIGGTLAVTAGTNPGVSAVLGQVISLAPASGATCTHKGVVTGTGALTVPTAGSTSVYLQSGATGTVDCSSTSYYQTEGGGKWGTTRLLPAPSLLRDVVWGTP